MGRVSWLGAAVLGVLGLAPTAAAPFGYGNAIIVRLGNATVDAVARPVGYPSPVFIDEVTLTGVLVQSIPINSTTICALARGGLVRLRACGGRSLFPGAGVASMRAFHAADGAVSSSTRATAATGKFAGRAGLPTNNVPCPPAPPPPPPAPPLQPSVAPFVWYDTEGFIQLSDNGAVSF